MILCIDTVTPESGVALVPPKGKPLYLPMESSRSSDSLFILIDQAFSHLKTKPKDLKGVAVIRGPGSFTSIRVGLAVANTFAHQLSLPIKGLTTDKWHSYKTKEKDFVYLQTMNRDEVYVVGFGRFSKKFPKPILPLSELPALKSAPWLGTLSAEHKKALGAGYKRMEEVLGAEETWKTACDNVFSKKSERKTYELAEPYYGKEAKITPSKRRFNLQLQ